VLIGAVFIDMVGGAILYPFFTLYVTRKFGVGMTQVGFLFGLFAIGHMLGSMIGGATADRYGRKAVLIFGIVASALSGLAMGLADSFEHVLFAALFMGLFGNVSGPAEQAMIADLVAEGSRAQGYGILRVAVNLAVAVGPALGGLLASRSYLLLFVSDVVASLAAAVVVAVALRETRPTSCKDGDELTIAETVKGYRSVLGDLTYVFFLGTRVLIALVFVQLHSTLAVYLRDVHGVSDQGFGYLMSLNAGLVVLFQFSATRWASGYRPLAVLAAGSAVYAVGYALYGVAASYVWFVLAMVLVTGGEMLVAPTSQAFAASIAPEEMRGRYMGLFGLSWTLASIIGPPAAGLILDSADPEWLWYACGVIGLLAALAFLVLQRQLRVIRQRPPKVSRVSVTGASD
jgi:MFS family permease